MPRSLDECYRIVASAIDACSLPGRPATTRPGVGFDETFEDLGFDSLAYMEFCIAIHVETAVEFNVVEVDALGTPAAVAKRLSEVA